MQNAPLPMIVLTNDDGIDAPGLKSLSVACAQVGRQTIIAPAEEHSGVGHRVTPRDPIRVSTLEDGRIKVFGTPADCSRIALSVLVPKAQWVIAGINCGGNLGMDLYMSGTVAAAREAAAMGLPSIAISQYVHPSTPIDWTLTSRRAEHVIHYLMGVPLQVGEFWNVNLPSRSDECVELPFDFCAPDSNHLDVRFRQDGDAFVFDGDYHNRPRRNGSDVDVCFSGRVSISRLSLELPHSND